MYDSHLYCIPDSISSLVVVVVMILEVLHCKREVEEEEAMVLAQPQSLVSHTHLYH